MNNSKRMLVWDSKRSSFKDRDKNKQKNYKLSSRIWNQYSLKYNPKDRKDKNCREKTIKQNISQRFLKLR